MTTMKNPEVAPENVKEAIEQTADVIVETERELLALAIKIKGAPDPPYEFEVA